MANAHIIKKPLPKGVVLNMAFGVTQLLNTIFKNRNFQQILIYKPKFEMQPRRKKPKCLEKQKLPIFEKIGIQ